MKNREKKRRTPLTLRDRIDIEQKYMYGLSITDIAQYINRNKSTVSREVKGKDRTGRNRYRADVTHAKALERISERGNTTILSKNKKLCDYVKKKLRLGWSPEQISGRLTKDYKKDKSMRISYEAIYQYIYAQVHRGGNGKVKKGCEDLRPYLARRHTRRAKKGFRKAQKAERNEKLPSIEQRPEVVDRRSRVGDWEDDLLVSKASKSCIKSVNERKTGVVFFGKTKDKTSTAGDSVLVSKLSAIPQKYRKTLTRDRGKENLAWEYIEGALGLKVFLAHSYCSWERGSNENCNGLLRRYFPKGTDWSKISDKEITLAEYLINTRPRKRLGWKTPAEVFYQETGVALFS
jgi:IS30 family transposase